MVIDPTTSRSATAVLGAFDPATNTGVVQLSDCGPNGATVGPHDNLLLGCTPANNPSQREHAGDQREDQALCPRRRHRRLG